MIGCGRRPAGSATGLLRGGTLTRALSTEVRIVRTLVILPTYNERDNLRDLAPAVLGVDRELDILVIDDDSPDGTGVLADRLAR